MAVYVAIVRISESESGAEFSFGPREPLEGKISLDKAKGIASVIKECPGDTAGFYSSRAKRKIELHWREGQVPERTSWAS